MLQPGLGQKGAEYFDLLWQLASQEAGLLPSETKGVKCRIIGDKSGTLNAEPGCQLGTGGDCTFVSCNPIFNSRERMIGQVIIDARVK